MTFNTIFRFNCTSNNIYFRLFDWIEMEKEQEVYFEATDKALYVGGMGWMTMDDDGGGWVNDWRKNSQQE